MTKRMILMLAFGIALTGCVKNSVHEATLKDLTDVRNTLTDVREKGRAIQEALAAEKKEVARLNEAIARLQEMIAAVKVRLEQEEKTSASLRDNLADTIKDRAKLKESAEQLRRALAELQARKLEAEQRVAEFRSLLAKFRTLIDSGKLQVQIRNGRMILVLPTDILFASGSADLSEEGKQAIYEVAAVLSTIPDREFQVEGHTDNVPIVSKKRFRNNWELASARAMGVLLAMMEAGMEGQVLSAASYGEFRPVTSNDTSDGRRQNRRIDIVIVPDLSTLPGFEELRQAMTAN